MHTQSYQEMQFKNAQNHWKEIKNNKDELQSEILRLKARANEVKILSLSMRAGFYETYEKAKDNCYHKSSY